MPSGEGHPDPAGRTGAGSVERILGAALDCYRGVGIAKTTMEDVASRAGVSRPTVYRHFATRDDLVAAVVVREAHALIDRTRAYIDTRPDLDSKIADGILRLVEDSHRDPVTRLLLDPQSVEMTGGLAAAFRTASEMIVELWRSVLAGVRPAGAQAPDQVGTWLAVVALIAAGRMQRAAPGDPRLRAALLQFVVPAVHAPAVGSDVTR